MTGIFTRSTVNSTPAVHAFQSCKSPSSPRIVEEIVEQCGEPVSALLVGDSKIDIATARAAGIPVIAVNWGFSTREDIFEADLVVDDAVALGEAIGGR